MDQEIQNLSLVHSAPRRKNNQHIQFPPSSIQSMQPLIHLHHKFLGFVFSERYVKLTFFVDTIQTTKACLIQKIVRAAASASGSIVQSCPRTA